MKRIWTIIGVRDVPRSFKWYQSLFGQRPTLPAHPDFGQLVDSDGTVLLCLHEWGSEDHPSLMSPDDGVPGNGLLLFFRINDFDLALGRARTLVTRLEEEPHVNPNTRTEEFSLRDPDGYYVTMSALRPRPKRSTRPQPRTGSARAKRTRTGVHPTSRRRNKALQRARVVKAGAHARAPFSAQSFGDNR